MVMVILPAPASALKEVVNAKQTTMAKMPRMLNNLWLFSTGNMMND